MYKMKQGPVFCCELCGKTFPFKKSLDEHQLTHDVELVNKMSVPQQTSACIPQHSVAPSLAVNSPMHASMHVNLSQDDVKPVTTKLKTHACDECGKSYTRKDHLTRHKLEHTGVRPHVCCVCNKAFIRKDKLQRHERIHFKDRDVKFCCSICGKTFLRKDGLNKHSKTHSVDLQLNSTIKTEQTGKDPLPIENQ